MCRLWAWEAFAHGAETVCYFRWRQAPFAQEQMHAGLLQPDSADAPALSEAAQVAQEIAELPEVGTAKAQVGLVFDYPSAWGWDVQPQGTGFDYFRLVFEVYRGLRKLGLDIDFVPSGTGDLTQYSLILAPGLMALPASLEDALSRFKGVALCGPRCNTKTTELTIPDPLPPNLPGLDMTINRSETFRADMDRPLEGGGHVRHWLDHVATNATVTERTKTGAPVLVGDDAVRYLAGWPDEDALNRILTALCQELQIKTTPMTASLRLRRTATHVFAFNYDLEPAIYEGTTIPPAGVHWSLM